MFRYRPVGGEFLRHLQYLRYLQYLRRLLQVQNEYMNGVPSQIDSKLLVGAKLTQVCTGLHEVILHFDNGTTLTIECNVTACTADSVDEFSESTTFGKWAVIALGKKIRSMESKNGKSLLITFDDDISIEIHDSNAPNYESFTIQNGNTIVIV